MNDRTNIWMEKWPTEPGYYWFYGQQFKASTVRLHFVNVMRVRNSLVYVCDNSIMYKPEAGFGLWMIIIPPELPELD